jgi:hypothetical protein
MSEPIVYVCPTCKRWDQLELSGDKERVGYCRRCEEGAVRPDLITEEEAEAQRTSSVSPTTTPDAHRPSRLDELTAAVDAAGFYDNEPTPRTDRAVNAGGNQLVNVTSESRQLERELAAANRALEAERIVLGANMQDREDAWSALHEITGGSNGVLLADGIKDAFRAEHEQTKHYQRLHGNAEQDVNHLSEQLTHERAVRRRLAEDIQKTISRVPACGQDGGMFVVHFDENGNEAGVEQINPIDVISCMICDLEQSLAASRALDQEDGK